MIMNNQLKLTTKLKINAERLDQTEGECKTEETFMVYSCNLQPSSYSSFDFMHKYEKIKVFG